MKALNKKLGTLFCALALFACIFSVNSTTFEEEENVLVLHDNNFDDAISQHKYILVKFYAPWCGHCKALAPEYIKAAGILKEKKLEIKFANVDATVEKGLSERFNIEGFPTLKFFKDGKPIEYNGGRKAEDLVSWVEKKAGPSMKILETKEQLDNFIQSLPVCIVFFGQESDKSYSLFKEVAESDENFQFAVVSNASLFAERNAEANDIILFKQFDEGRVVLDRQKERNASNIMDFIQTNSLPLVTGFNEGTAEFIFGRSKTGLFLYRDPKKDSSLDEMLRSIAPEYKGRIFFIACGITEDLEEKLAEYIGVTEADLPVLKIHEVGEIGVKKFTLKKPISKENIKEFLEEYLSNKLVPEFKSEEIPTSQDPNSHVVKIVGKSWEQIVKDSTKDVLVKFYAPWCGHCKALAPKWENLAKTLSGYPSIVIAEIDATANEVEGEEIEHYPTLRFYSHKNKKAEEVEGRNEYELLEFLKSKELVTKIGDEIVFEKPAAEEEEQSHEGEGEEDVGEGEGEGEGENEEEVSTENKTEKKPDL